MVISKPKRKSQAVGVCHCMVSLLMRFSVKVQAEVTQIQPEERPLQRVKAGIRQPNSELILSFLKLLNVSYSLRLS
jgi:hypothetical protein